MPGFNVLVDKYFMSYTILSSNTQERGYSYTIQIDSKQFKEITFQLTDNLRFNKLYEEFIKYSRNTKSSCYPKLITNINLQNHLYQQLVKSKTFADIITTTTT